MKGVAPIKVEYLKKAVASNVNDETSQIQQTAKRELDEKSTDTTTQSKKRRKGQNKNREKFSDQRKPPADRLCKAILCETTCSYGDSCKFSHDVKGFLAKKPADIGEACHNFITKGRCPYGFACRYGSSHIKEVDGQFVNLIDESIQPSSASVNGITSEVLISLRKRKYDFKKAIAATQSAKVLVDEIVKKNVELNSTKKSAPADSSGDENRQMEDMSLINETSEPTKKEVSSPRDAPSGGDKADLEARPNIDNSKTINDTNIECSEAAVEKLETKSEVPQVGFTRRPVGPLTNEDQFNIKPNEKKTIDFQNKLYLAPLTTVGNLPFRRICKRFGADITCGEMALATKLLQGVTAEWALVKKHSCEDVFGVQLCGAYPDTMAKATQLLNETCDIDFIDINVGCPIDLIFDQGAGSALMRRVNRFHEIVHSMVQASDIPITAKIRTGVSDTKNTAHSLLARMKGWGIALTTLHGRSREQRYTKLADWDYISECAKLAYPMPLYGGGDILSFEDYNKAMTTNVSGTMIARGALIKPWIFSEIKEQQHWDISSGERLDILRKFTNYGLEHWGSDDQGVEATRRFLLEWLSFLHRYIPVGVLEQLPQRINERPPPFIGRDDLETLMASPLASDWVKISEMLLGPVPNGFFFIPKHRASSYS